MTPLVEHEPQRDRWLRIATRATVRPCSRRERPQARNQLAGGDVAQRHLDRWPKIDGFGRDPHARACKEHEPAASLLLGRDRGRHAAQGHGLAGVPLDRGMPRRDAHALVLHPATMPDDERLRLAPRAAARDGDAQRAVRPDAEDVLARAAHPDELDVRLGRGRSAEEGQIQLHSQRIRQRSPQARAQPSLKLRRRAAEVLALAERRKPRARRTPRLPASAGRCSWSLTDGDQPEGSMGLGQRGWGAVPGNH